MNGGYSKMRVSTGFTNKARSIDFSDLSFSPELKVAHEHPYPTPKGDQHREADDEGQQQRSELLLSRSCSSASQRFTSLQTKVRKAFSMRKSSSVAGSYWRIHDTGDGDGDGEEEFVEEQQQQQQQQMRSSGKKMKGKILRACKKMFGF